LPNRFCRPDEEQIVDIVSSPLRNFHPERFNYPSFYKYINLCFYGLYFILGLFTGKYKALPDFINEIVVTNYKDLYLINRLLSAFFGVATVFICYKVAKMLFDRKTAIISAFFLSFAYLHVRDSHFGTVDIPMVFFMMCSMFFIIKAYKSSLFKDCILAGIFAGLAASTKYTGILLIIPMLVVTSLTIFAAKGKYDVSVSLLFFAKRMSVFLLFFTAAFLLGTPYALLDLDRFLGDCVETVGRFIDGESINLGKGWWYHLRFSLPLGMGLSLFFASLAGILVLIKDNFRKALILCSFPLAYYAIVGQGYGVYLRYAVPFIPYFCITAAVFTVYLLNGLRKYLSPSLHKGVMLMIPFLIISPSAYNILRFDILLSQKDNRLIAAEWINRNVPEGSSIANFTSCLDMGDFSPAGPGLLDKIKGYKEYGYDPGSKEFKCGEEPVDMPQYIVLEESPLKMFSEIDKQQKEVIRKFYYLLLEFKAINIYNKVNWFDQDDCFYMPFAGFKEIQRPGPNLYIYEKK